jgi:hypothetical protein
MEPKIGIGMETGTVIDKVAFKLALGRFEEQMGTLRCKNGVRKTQKKENSKFNKLG